MAAAALDLQTLGGELITTTQPSASKSSTTHYHINHKMVKSQSTSEWAILMKVVKNNLAELDTKPELLGAITAILDKIVSQLEIDKQLLADGKLTKISDCALHAPRNNSSKSIKSKPIRPAQYCAKKLFIDSGKMPNQDWANNHWQRLIARLSRAFIEQEQIKAIQAAEFKTARLLEHQRKGWCALKERTIAIPVGRPAAMKVEIAPLDELSPFFQHLAADGVMFDASNPRKHLEFTRGAIYPDGRMDLCKQVVGPTWIGALMDALKTNTQVEHFLLGNNIIGLAGGEAIGKYLATPHSNKIKTWYLAGCELTALALKAIVDGFISAADKDVVALWLKRNPPFAEGMPHIRRLLENNMSIKVLDLHNTAIGIKESAYKDESNYFEKHLTENGIRELCEGLKVNETLERLYLGANALDHNSMQYLADYFRFKTTHQRPGITSIWLDMNRIADEGCRILCESLEHYPIRSLELGSNLISEDGMAYIAHYFQNHPTLENLGLGLYKATADMGTAVNNISDAGVPAICELITKTNLRRLDISMNNISSDGMALVAASLEKNTTLWYLNYKQYGHEIAQTTVQKINELLARNRAMHHPQVEFGKEHERRLIHGDDIWTIDSIYRNSMK